MEVIAAVAIAVFAIAVGYILPDNGRQRLMLAAVVLAVTIGIMVAVTGV